jgi:hypothetical protein
MPIKLTGLFKLCPPALLYLVLSSIALAVTAYQNANHVNLYCIGTYSCSVASTWLIFALQIIYVIFWTWILNIICDAGHPGVSWFLVLFPFLLFFSIVLITMSPRF